MMLERFLHGEPLNSEKFARPHRDFGILPFWFWNGDLRPDEMRRQMEEMKSQGMPGFFIHSRFGLAVPYLSDEWFARVRQVMAWAAELDLTAWVYDEKNWPSGTVGWEVPRQYPDLAQRYLEMIVLDVPGPLFVFLEGTDGRYLDMEDAEPVCAFAVTAREYEHGIANPIDLTPNLSFEKIVPWEAPAGDWKLLYFVERRAKWYIDALNPESTRRFLAMTHDRYAAEVGTFFGRVLPGFYTDEPACHYFEVGLNNRIVPWTKGMFKLFRERNGYELRSVLPALFLPFGERTSQIRYDFWRTVSEQYHAVYYGQIHDWCKRHGVLATGHIMHEEYLRSQARCEGDLFDIFKHFDIVGVDHLYPVIGTARDPEQHVALKIASSAAHHYGTRLLCESLGGSFWDVTMERMKWIADWEYVLGVNLFNPHGFHYSIEGERKRDWPPSQFYHHTWWDHYGLFQSYLTRLSYLLSGGLHVAKIAVLYPINAEWANYAPQSSGPVTEAIEGDFAFLADALLRLHYDYDFLGEDLLSGAAIEESRLKLNGEAYSAVILPAATHIKESTMDLLERFTAAGGTVLATTLLPEAAVDTGRSLAERSAALFGREPAAVKAAFAGGPPLTRHERSHGDGRAILLAGPGLRRADARRELGDILRERIVPDAIIDDTDVFYLHRVKDGRQLYFFVNPTPHARTVRTSLEGRIAPEIWDPGDGTVRPLWVYRHQAGRTEFTLDMAPFGSTVVVGGDREPEHLDACNMVVEDYHQGIISGYALSPGPIEAKAGARSGRAIVGDRPVVLSLGEGWRFRPEGRNALIQDSWRVKIAGPDDDYSRMDLDDSDWMTFTRGGWEAQVPGGAEDAAYPVILWYRAEFHAAIVPDDLRLVVDGFKGEAAIYVNGSRLVDMRPSRIDAMMREIPLAGTARPGRNVLAVRLVVTSRSDGILDLLKFVGSFALCESESGYTIAAQPDGEVTATSWTGFGYPFYSGTGVYEREIEVPASCGGRKMFVEIDCGDDLAEVLADGVSLGMRPWHPYRLDAGSALSPGRHLLTVKITNSLANLLDGKPKPSGLLGPVMIHAFPRCTVRMSGEAAPAGQ